MTSREIIERNLSDGKGVRFGMTFGGGRANDFVSAGIGASAVWSRKTWVVGDMEFYTDEWGNTWHRLVNMSAGGEIFKPLYRRLCVAAHKNGLQVLMHSCGYNWAILDDLGEVGVNAFQFDQPELYGLDRLAGKLKEIGVCLWSPVDIQKIMPTGNGKLIEKSAERMVELFFSRNGRFIAKNYGDLKGIGVKEEWDQWAYDKFAFLAGFLGR